MEDVENSLLSLNKSLAGSGSTKDYFRQLQHIRERISELENDIGGLPKDRREPVRVSRPILSLIRGLHLALENLNKHEKMREFETFVKTFNKIEHFFDGRDSASSILGGIRSKGTLVVEQISLINKKTSMMTELKELQSVLEKESSHDPLIVEKTLLRAEALMSRQMQAALHLQSKVEVIMNSYNTLIQTMTKRFLKWDAFLNHCKANTT
mmetsp:Transcript_41835/g.67938  ORF Transcript_41835/g.67938 Transcript_41835/m.67938 type:complete len:210 (+) Transcript_41835:77-706(+)